MSNSETVLTAEPERDAPIKVMIISPRNLATMESVMEEAEKLFGPPQT